MKRGHYRNGRGVSLSKIVFKLILAGALSSLLSCATLTVSRVIDGDTLVLSNGRHIRLIGVDTPESFTNRKLAKDAKILNQEKTVMQGLGKKAATYTRSIALNKQVRVKSDREAHDRYGRTLGYVFFTNGTMLNEKLIKDGYGCAYTRFPFKYHVEFVSAEQEARREGRGLWPTLKCPEQPPDR